VHACRAQLGLDSLSTVNLVSLVSEQFGRDVPLRVLFASPTIRDLARLLRTGELGDDANLSGGDKERSHPAWADLRPDAQLLQLGEATQPGSSVLYCRAMASN
jgi:aryl carrier-like protein